jgi:CubicO group peptidase (beta-lactamase class C family)
LQAGCKKVTLVTVSTDNLEAEVTVGGFVAPGYEPVEQAFAENFRSRGDVGAAFALYSDGRKVVDIWGGVADKRAMTPYTDDTLQLVFSSTKGVTALLANLLVQRGILDVDAPVTDYWPEFGAAGKQDIPVRWLLCHKAGLPAIEAPLTLDQLLAWEPAVEALAAQEPVWEPGAAHGYHAVTFGWLVGEVLRRATGRNVGDLVQSELSGPLGLELWIGLPEDQQARVAPLTYTGLNRDAPKNDGVAGTGLGGGDLATMIEKLLGPDSLLMRALDGAPGVFTERGIFNRPEVRAAELPAANGVTTARSMAKLYAATIGPVEDTDKPQHSTSNALLTNDQLTAATSRQTSGPDKVLIVDTDFGLGYMRASSYSPYGGARAFGHSGAGGSVGFADPEHGIGFAYTMNRMMHGLAGDPRIKGLVTAVYDVLGVEPTYL